MSKYPRLFIDESRQYLDSLDQSLRDAGTDGARSSLLAESSRLAHSIKGMALFEEQPFVADLAYALERGFARSAEEGGGEEALFEHLGRGERELTRMIDDIDSTGAPQREAADVVGAITRCVETP